MVINHLLNGMILQAEMVILPISRSLWYLPSKEFLKSDNHLPRTFQIWPTGHQTKKSENFEASLSQKLSSKSAPKLEKCPTYHTRK